MLSNRLKSLIADTELTQKDIANRLELSQQRFNSYVSGKRAPDYETLGKIADFFHVSTDYLLDRTDDPETTHPLAGHGALSHEELQILSAYRQADDHTRELVALALKPYSEAMVPPAQPGAVM